jgi:hypothetical protein
MHVAGAATGKEIFNSRKTLSSWNICGRPHFITGELAKVRSSSESAPPASEPIRGPRQPPGLIVVNEAPLLLALGVEAAEAKAGATRAPV